MSYEPDLIIRKSDLEKHREYLCAEDYMLTKKQQEEDKKNKGGEENTTPREYLGYVLTKHTVFKIGNIEMVMCQPCFSNFNGLVREKLKELEVEFACSY